MKPRSAKKKGSKGEHEIVHLYRRFGYPGTIRSPGSGALRSYGAGSLSPFPGDVIVKRDERAKPEPLLIEVKYDERVYRQGEKVHRTWAGSTFIISTLRDLQKLADRHNGTIGGGRLLPVLHARSNLKDWRTFIPEERFRDWLGAAPMSDARSPWRDAWVELDLSDYFDLLEA